MKASGDAKLRQLEQEQKRRIELNKVVTQFKLPIDLNAIDDIDKQTSTVLDSLKKLFSTSESQLSGASIINGNRAAYDSYQKLVGGFVLATKAANQYSGSLKNLEGEQDALKDFEKSLGTDLAAINKLFDVTTPTKTNNDEPKGDKGKKDDKVKAAKELEEKRFKLNLLFAEKNFALREKDARETIKDQKALAFELEKIEKEKNIAILSIKQDYANKGALANETEFIKLGNLIDQAVKEYNEFESTIRKIDVVDILPTSKKDIIVKNAKDVELALISLSASILATTDPKVKAQLQKQYETIVNSIKSVGSPKLNKLTFESGGFDAIDLEQLLPKDRVPALQGRLGLVAGAVEQLKAKLQAGLGDPLDLKAFDSLQEEGEKIIDLLKRLGIEIPEMSEKIISGTKQVLGISPESLQLIGQSVDLARDAFATITDVYVTELDNRIAAQESRVRDAEKIAEKGNVKQLQIEEERLAKLTEERSKAAERQAIIEKAAAQAQIIINTALTISNLQVAAASTAAATNVAAPVTVPIVLAIVGALIASAANLFTPPSFKDGIEYFSDKRDGRVIGPGNGRSDSVPAWLSNGERVVDALINSQLGDFPNAKLPEAVKYYQMRPTALPVIAMGNSRDNSGVEAKLDSLKESFEALRINISLDQKGFVAEIDRLQQKRTGRKRYKS